MSRISSNDSKLLKLDIIISSGEESLNEESLNNALTLLLLKRAIE